MRRGRPRYPDILTRREWEVLELLRRGMTNDQIAGELGISRDGAKYHVSEILSKLGLLSRHEAAQWQPASVQVRSRKVFMLGAAIGHKVAYGVIAAGVVAVAALAAVVLLMQARGDSTDQMEVASADH